MASQLMVELETIRRRGEQIGARQDQLSGDLQQLNHQVARISEATRQFPPLAHADRETAAAETAAAEAATAETATAQANGREGPAGVPGPARPADEALDSPSGPVAAGPGPG